MSNNQMVSAPKLLAADNDRDMLEYLSEGYESQVYVCEQCGYEEPLETYDLASDLREYLAAYPHAPAEQHQGEPAAKMTLEQLLADLPDGYSKDDVAYGWHECVDNYPHADPAEVERLRDQLAAWQALAAERLEVASGLRAQLAERDALLGAIAGWTTETRAAVLEAFQDELNESASYAWYDAAIADLMKLVEALSASTEPSAPTWSCQACQAEQPTDRPCDACGGNTEPVAIKS